MTPRLSLAVADSVTVPLAPVSLALTVGGVVSPLPPALLMEMMELRERIEGFAQDGRGLLNISEEIKKMAQDSTRMLGEAFAKKDYNAAVNETLRLQYITKALEEAYMLLYRFKSQAHS